MPFKFNPFTRKLDITDVGGGGSGDVTGPASAVADNIVTFNGTTGKVIKDSGIAISSINSSYALSVVTTGTNSPADSTTYGMLNSLAWLAGVTTAPLRFYIPKTGTITACAGAFTASTIQASAENITVGLRLNGTTNYTVTTTLQATSVINPFSNLSLNIPVTVGDYVIFYVTTPAWSTNPTNCCFSATLFAT